VKRQRIMLGLTAGVFGLLGLLIACADSADSKAELRGQVEALEEGQSLTHGGVKMTLHKKATGSLGPDGWVTATSVGCGFTVRLPARYNDFTTTATAKDGAVISMHTVGTVSPSGMKLVAMCVERSDNTLPPGWADETAGALEGSARYLTRQPVSLQGLQGTEILIESPNGSRLAARYLGDGQRGYQLSVEYPQQLEPQAGALVSTFFGSFSPE